MANVAPRPARATLARGVDSVVPRACRKVSPRCAVAVASRTGLARKVMLSKVPATSEVGDFVEAAADKAAFRP